MMRKEVVSLAKKIFNCPQAKEQWYIAKPGPPGPRPRHHCVVPCIILPSPSHMSSNNFIASL